MPNSSTICCDASLVIDWLLDENAEYVAPLFKGWLREGRRIVAPALQRYEVTNVLFRRAKFGALSEAEASELLAAYHSIPIEFLGSVELHATALAIALKYQLAAAYDAHYLAVAQFTESEFWTADRRLFNAVSRDLRNVHLVSNASG